MPWTVFFTAFAVIASALFCLVALLSAIRARHATASSARRLRLLELHTESLTESVTQMQVELLRIANSKKMTDVRMATEHTSKSKRLTSVINSEPDVTADPEGWRAWKNSQLRAGVYNQ